MANNLLILVVSKKAESVDAIERLLRGIGYDLVDRKLLTQNGKEHIYTAPKTPETITVRISDHWRQELESISAMDIGKRPALIMVSDSSDTEMLRLALHAGALDLLNLPLNKDDFVKLLSRLGAPRLITEPREQSRVITFMNTFGGCGSSFLAMNTAHVLAEKFQRRVALVDLELQFGTLPFYLDIYPKRGISQALENLGTIDEVAVKGYLTSHASGVDVLSNGVEPGVICKDISPEKVTDLLKIVRRAYDFLIVDMPRHLEPLTKFTIMNSSHVVLVMQQSVISMACASKILNCLRHEMGLSEDQIFLVINRYDHKASITIDEIKNTLKISDPLTIPSDYDFVSECVNSGTPALTLNANNEVSKSIFTLSSRVSDIPVPEFQGGFLKKLASYVAVNGRAG